MHDLLQFVLNLKKNTYLWYLSIYSVQMYILYILTDEWWEKTEVPPPLISKAYVNS